MPESPDERNDFLRAILASPDDEERQLVFADWLDEHGGEEKGDRLL